MNPEPEIERSEAPLGVLTPGRTPARDADPTDYEHRDFINLLGAAFLLMIAIALVWTVRAMEDYEDLQRCLISARRSCMELNVPPSRAVHVPTR